ncbi:hypothetical protein ACFS5N_11945 [Mucilaginibacter ximonensis]|uniref:Lipoprotein n=1 Tax=Mucilaginibacter ximonensis TaxID=538021 RepID=A0ABW5YD49_9SPHI
MKKLFILSITTLAIAGSITSCKKEGAPSKSLDARTVKFKLYTDKDFSGDEHNITFSIFIKDGSTHLFDSTYATMKIKDIPKAANAIITQKTIHASNNTLTVGFIYEIQGIGVSWHLDTLTAGQKSKVVDYNFQ